MPTTARLTNPDVVDDGDTTRHESVRVSRRLQRDLDNPDDSAVIARDQQGAIR